MREYNAAVDRASVNHGKTKRPFRTDTQIDSPGGMPLEGRIPSLNQKMYRARSASQKTGADTPKRAKIMPARSTALRGLIADTIPIGIPMRSRMIAAPTARGIVTGSREEMSSRTGTWFWYEK